MKNLPIGISDFKEVIDDNYYYVDKTLLVKEIKEASAKILLFPRPRRFGKTLNMSMLKYFFEKTTVSNSYLFENTKIWQHKEYKELQGNYPVIYLTFKDTKELTWQKAYERLVTIISAEFKYHYSFIKPEVLEPELIKYNTIRNRTAAETDYGDSLRMLSELLFKSTGKRVIVLIDEYDVPIHSGYSNGYYKEVTSFIKSLLSGVLKDNEYLEKGILTGILMIAKEGILTGLNNLKSYSLISSKFDTQFGFTQAEVEKLLKDYDMLNMLDDVQSWYNGYKFGNNVIYNPWSMLNFLDERELKPYWVNTSDNELIKDLIAVFAVKSDFELLLSDQAIKKEIDQFIIFPNLKDSSTSVWSLLLFTGYLTYTECELIEGVAYCNLVIPNKEIRFLYRDFLRYFFKASLGTTKIELLLTAIKSGDISTFGILLQEFVVNSMSMYDLPGNEPERSYHLFVLGLLVLLADEYQVKSNRESGYGRYDIMLIPKDRSKLGYVIEFKKVHSDKESLEESAQKAMEQIKAKCYAQELKDLGITNILLLGIAFKGKQLLVLSADSSYVE